MATTLTADQEELVHFSFPIEKREDTAEINPIDGTPDILIWGKATDGTVDADRQIVDPEWSAAALKEWVATGGNVRMSHDPKRPVGKGQEVQVTMDGHYVRSKICDPLAKHFIRNGVLNDYSVGISAPHIKYGPDKALDPRGSATGGIITGRPDGLSKIAELSVVDRGSNFNSKFQIAKSAGNSAEFVGAMIGDEDEITKAAPASLTKAVHDAIIETPQGDVAEKSASATAAGIDTWSAPEDLSITFTPNDLARMVQNKFVEKHYDELAAKAAAETDTEKRDVGAAERRNLAGQRRALPDGSYPIKSHKDAENAVTLALSGHGDAGAAKSLIRRVAREEGWQDILDRLDGKNGGDAEKGAYVTDPAENAEPEAVKEADADLTKSCSACSGGDCDGASCSCGSCGDGKCACGKAAEKAAEPAQEPKDKPVKKAKKKGKKLPPWLNKPADDAKGDSDDDDSCKMNHVHTEKCHTPPSVAAGVNAAPMNPAPVGELLETDPVPSTVSKGGPTPASASGAVAESMKPVPAHREPDGSPMEAFEVTTSMSDGDNEKPTRLEASMKAGNPEVAALLRFQHAGIDPEAGRLHDLTCPAYHPADVAKHHPFHDLAAAIDLDGFQRKAMRAAAGGDLGYAKAMQQVLFAASSLKTADPAFLNDCRMAAYKAFRDANPGPSSFPTPGSISPQSYNRPLVTEGHEASSPGHDGPNSSPQVATSAPDAHSFDRPPLSAGHQSPSPSFMKASFEYPAETGRPVQLNYETMEKERARQALVQVHEHLSRQFPEACPMSLDGPQQPENHPVPTPAGIGKGNGVEAKLEPGEVAIPKSAMPAVAAALKADPEDAGLFMDADIYKGFKKMRKKLGKKVLSGSMTVDEARAKLGRQFAQKGDGESQGAVEKSASAPASVLSGVMSREEAQREYFPNSPAAPPVAAVFDPDVIKSAVAEATSELKDLLVKQQEDFTTKLAEQQKVIDAIADQPDPSTAAFSGLAFNPVQKAARPAAVPDIAESAARAQDMIRRNLQSTYYTHSSPAVREAAGQELAKLGWEPSMT